MPSDTAARLALSPSLLGGATAGLAQTHLLRAFHPVNEGSGLAFFTEHLVAPLRAAFPHGEERTDIAMSGTFGGATWLARSGHIAGRFEALLFGIPATGQAAFVRFGRFERFEDDRNVETILILDLPALIDASGLLAACTAVRPACGRTRTRHARRHLSGACARRARLRQPRHRRKDDRRADEV